MSDTFSDTIRVLGREFAVVGGDGFGRFEPCAYGLRPVMISARCCRGYRCRYAVAPVGLVLDELAIGLGGRDAESARRGVGPALFGRFPRPRDPFEFDCDVDDEHGDEPLFLYERLDAPVPFTGRWLVGADLVPGTESLPAPYRFARLVELTFERGRLVEAVDHSPRMARARAQQAHREAMTREVVELIRRVDRLASIALSSRF